MFEVKETAKSLLPKTYSLELLLSHNTSFTEQLVYLYLHCILKDLFTKER